MQASWQELVSSLALDTAPQPLLDNALYPQYSQGFLEIAGADADKFLQGQLSCDVSLVTLTRAGLGSHSNAKGRMQSSFRICRTADNTFLLRVHSSIIEQARAALAKYIVFSKAGISVASSVAGIGLHGPKARLALSKHFTTIPEADFQQTIENGCVLVCTSSEYHSYEIYTDFQQATDLWNSLSITLEASPSNQHRLLEHQLGLAFVEADTFNAFIPQMYNYQCTPAISFKKGCFTGQEIVARMHYLGKMKRHMRHYTASCAVELTAGMIVSDTGGNNIGDILGAVQTGTDCWDLLINLTNEAASAGTLSVAGHQFRNLKEIPLPYHLGD